MIDLSKGGASVTSSRKSFSMKVLEQAFTDAFTSAIEQTLNAEVVAIRTANPNISELDALKKVTRYETVAKDGKPSRVSYGVQVTVPPFKLFGVDVVLREFWVPLPIK